MIVARMGCPVVLGLGQGEQFVASDVAALLPVTRRFIFLEEGDIAEFDVDSWSVRNLRTGQALKVSQVPEQLLATMLGGGIYPVLEREGLIAPRRNA